MINEQLQKTKKSRSKSSYSWLLQEYIRVLNTTYYSTNAMGKSLQSLPGYIDDLHLSLGADIYDRMMKDPIVKAGVSTAVATILADDIQWHAAVNDPGEDEKDEVKQSDFNNAEEGLKFWEEVLKAMKKPMKLRVAECLTPSLSNGHKLAEKIVDLRDGMYVLLDLRPLPRNSIQLVVDDKMDFVGVIEAGAYVSGQSIKPDDLDKDKQTLSGRPIYPAEKFALFTHDPVDNDPRGTSILRAAYNAWYVKQTFWPSLAKGMGQAATPSFIAIEGEQMLGTGEDDEGAPSDFSEATDILNALLGMQNGSVAVVPHGTEVQQIGGTNVAENFDKAFSIVDSQILYAILSQNRSNKEAEHGSRADSETGKNIVDILMSLKREEVESVLYDIAFGIFEVNFGREWARRYTPIPKLSAGPQEDFSKNASAVAALHNAGYIADDQLAEIDIKLGLPRRSMEAWREKQEAERQQSDIMRRMVGDATNPDDDGDEFDNLQRAAENNAGDE
jgi:hypothetical protein